MTNVADPFAPVQLGPITLRNAVIKAATFEGMSRKNIVSDRLIDYHRAVAAGGVGMTTLAYCAVSMDGRGAPGEIVLGPEAAPGLRQFVEAMHAEGAMACAQVGHAGPVGAAAGGSALAPSRVFAKASFKFTRSASGDDLTTVIRQFADGARLLADAGFDAVELHYGHGYLISAFMSPKLNKRTDGWGGTLENRARLAREIASATRAAIGDRIALTAKLNMADGVPGGLWLDESIEIARLLEADGQLDALQLTGGSSFENPMYLFRGEAPIREMAATFPKVIGLGFRVLGKRFMPTYPFEEAYFLPYARQFRDALSMPLILLGGITKLATIQQALGEGFTAVAMARALLREPDLVVRMQKDASAESLCIHCNKCMPTIYRGTHCVLVAPEQRPGLTSASR